MEFYIRISESLTLHILKFVVIYLAIRDIFLPHTRIYLHLSLSRIWTFDISRRGTGNNLHSHSNKIYVN